MAAFCLDFHAAYQCRHSGACCDSWSVPAEPAVVEIVRARSIRRQGNTGPLFVRSAGAPDEELWTIARDPRGQCVFFDRQGGGLCIIHRDVGEEALPSACRHFPRKVLHDARGTLISLSHFCPTAAAMLLAGREPSIVEARPPLRLESAMEGLDARHALPPVLRPGMLCDVDGYESWERAGVASFARSEPSYARCLDDLAAVTEIVRQWTPGDRSLSDSVRIAFATGNHDAPAPWCDARAIQRVARLTAGSAGDDLAPIADFDAQRRDRLGIAPIDWFDRGMKNYLAARLFGNWIAYQGQGLRSIVEWLRTCAAVVHHFVLRRLIGSAVPLDRCGFIESVRSADLLLLHALDSQMFAQDIARVEESSQR